MVESEEEVSVGIYPRDQPPAAPPLANQPSLSPIYTASECNLHFYFFSGAFRGLLALWRRKNYFLWVSWDLLYITQRLLYILLLKIHTFFYIKPLLYRVTPNTCL